MEFADALMSLTCGLEDPRPQAVRGELGGGKGEVQEDPPSNSSLRARASASERQREQESSIVAMGSGEKKHLKKFLKKLTELVEKRTTDPR